MCPFSMGNWGNKSERKTHQHVFKSNYTFANKNWAAIVARQLKSPQRRESVVENVRHAFTIVLICKLRYVLFFSLFLSEKSLVDTMFQQLCDSLIWIILSLCRKISEKKKSPERNRQTKTTTAATAREQQNDSFFSVCTCRECAVLCFFLFSLILHVYKIY